MNRALRRQQLKDPKDKRGARASSGRPAMQRAAPAQRPAAGGRRGAAAFTPRIFNEVWSELRKVTWPSREDVLHLSVVVIIVTMILGAVLGAIDLGFGWLIDETLLS